MNHFSDQSQQAEGRAARLEKQFSSSAWISFHRPVLVVVRSRSQAPRSIGDGRGNAEKGAGRDREQGLADSVPPADQ